MVNFNFYRKRSFGLDLGNTNTLINDQHSIVMRQPSYIAFNKNTKQVKAVGDSAYSMFEKTHEELQSVKPLRGGVIADFESASEMIRTMLQQAFPETSMIKRYDHIISGIPYATTEVERRALRSALDQFQARHTHLVYEPLAAALGMGLNIAEPNGKMVVDIGGGITEIVVISLSGIASFNAVKVAGDTFDIAIQDYFRKQYGMAIGIKTAEQIKIKVGAVMDNIQSPPAPVQVIGKSIQDGIPVSRSVGYKEIASVLDKFFHAIEYNIIQTIESCSPELAGDIYENGIYVTGGGALLRGLKERFESRIKVDVHIDEQPLIAVSKGVSQTLGDPRKFKSVLFE
ncbi:MAG TPA: rod shape-determining protein [Cyclobacteriaceae bacterium]